MIKYFVLVSALFAGLAFSHAVQAQNNSLNEAQIAAVEAAEYRDWDGNPVRVSDFAGKTVLIDFWETWCSPCLAIMPALNQLMADFPDDFVVLAVSPGWSDTETVVRRFIDQHDYDFIFVHGDELATKLEIRGIPYKVYVRPDGTFYKTETGSRGPQREFDAISEVIRSHRGE